MHGATKALNPSTPETPKINIDIFSSSRYSKKDQNVKGEKMLSPKMKTKAAFRVIGKTCESTMKQNNIPALWDQFGKFNPQIPGILNPQAAIGVCYFEEMDKMTDDTPFTYLAGMEVKPDQEAPEGMLARDVPAAEYAVFEHVGSLATLHETYDAIYGEWMPKSGYSRAEADDFELYDERFKFGQPDSVMEIWVPIVRLAD